MRHERPGLRPENLDLRHSLTFFTFNFVSLSLSLSLSFSLSLFLSFFLEERRGNNLTFLQIVC